MRTRTEIEAAAAAAAAAKNSQQMDALILEILLDIRDQNRRLSNSVGSNPQFQGEP